MQGLRRIADQINNILRGDRVTRMKNHLADGGTEEFGLNRQGRLDGAYTVRDRRGIRLTEGTYLDGKQHGRFLMWDSLGRLRSDCVYRHGLLDEVHRLVERGRDTVLPSGDVVVWKACRSVAKWYPLYGFGSLRRDLYVALLVPAEARRVTPLHGKGKSRVEFARVLDIVDRDGNHYTEAEACVFHNGGHHLRYVVGQEVRPDTFDPDPTVTCGHGLHVYRHRDQCDRWFRPKVEIRSS